MSKNLKIIINIVMMLIILWGVIFLIDFFRCTNFKMPIFVVTGETADDGGSGIYYGLGYKVIVEKSISAEYGDQLEKIEMYFGDKFVTGAIAQINTQLFEQEAKINYMLKIIESQEKELKKITTDKLAEKYDYDIYYYGLDNVIIEINNEEVDLKEALLNDSIAMEQIIEQAKNDSENEIIRSDMYKDGGTMEYYYDTYTIIKSDTLDGNRDVYIGIPEMRLAHVR